MRTCKNGLIIYDENLPRRTKQWPGTIIWEDSIGKIVGLEFHGSRKNVEIVKYDKQTVWYKYNGVIYKNRINSFLRGSGITKRVFKEHYETAVYQYKIGDIISGKNGKIFDVVERMDKWRTKNLKSGSERTHEKFYKIRCKKCGHISDWQREDSLVMNVCGCKRCSHQILVSGENDLASTIPEWCKYFVNKNDAFNVSIGSHKYIELQCPICKKVTKMTPANIKKVGYRCRDCSDGIPQTEKFIFSMLNQAGIEFEYQPGIETLSWCGKHRYDFYIPLSNVIIEVDGSIHFHSTHYSDVNDVEMKDKEKDNLAISNGVNIIRINLKEDKINTSNIDAIINRVKESGISKIINLSTIDWDVCLEYSRSNLKLCASDLWNKGLCISEISKEMKLSKSTICKYLKYMKKCGQNNYTKEKSRSRGVLYEKRNRRANCKN